MYYNNYNNDYLMHFGVKGMKWGVRKKREPLQVSDTRRKFDSTKAEYKQAKKAYSKSYDKAYNYSSLHPVSQLVGKKAKAESDRRWNDAIDKAEQLRTAKTNYKQAKKERRQQLEEARKDVRKNTKLGEKLLYNDATRDKAAKYMVDNGMSREDANKRAKRDANRNTAIIGATIAAAYIAPVAIAAVKKYADTRSRQKANAGLARIGTYKMEHLGQNVYRKVMR